MTRNAKYQKERSKEMGIKVKAQAFLAMRILHSPVTGYLHCVFTQHKRLQLI